MCDSGGSCHPETHIQLIGIWTVHGASVQVLGLAAGQPRRAIQRGSLGAIGQVGCDKRTWGAEGRNQGRLRQYGTTREAGATILGGWSIVGQQGKGEGQLE